MSYVSKATRDKKVNSEIARLHKKIHNLESKVFSFYHESQINSYMQIITDAFDSNTPILQKVMLTKSCGKHFDTQGRLFWMDIFCINHNFFELIKTLLNTSRPSESTVRKWFSNEIIFSFLDYQQLGNVIPIFKYYCEKFDIDIGQRLVLSFDGMKFMPGLQRTTKDGSFCGFTTEYYSQCQKEVANVINGSTSQKDFLHFCCENHFLGDYIFVYYISSLDNP